MLKEYLVVAQEALEAKKEMYLVKQQRLELAQKEMLLFHELSEDNRSITSGKTQRCPVMLHTQRRDGNRWAGIIEDEKSVNREVPGPVRT